MKIEVLTDKLEIVFKKSDDPGYAVGWRPWTSTPEFEKGFTETDTVLYSYSDITFDYRWQEINYVKTDLNGNRDVDRMIFQNKDLERKFYEDLYNAFIK